LFAAGRFLLIVCHVLGGNPSQQCIDSSHIESLGGENAKVSNAPNYTAWPAKECLEDYEMLALDGETKNFFFMRVFNIGSADRKSLIARPRVNTQRFDTPEQVLTHFREPLPQAPFPRACPLASYHIARQKHQRLRKLSSYRPPERTQR
jgi:hypothetical protein